MSAPILLLLRNDLRIGDHPALAAAVATGAPIVPLFILDDASDAPWARGGASRWWLHHSLARLSESLEALGGTLVLRRGDTIDHIARIASDTRACAVYCSRSYEPAGIALEQRMHERLASSGVAMKRFAGMLLREPEEMRTQGGQPFKVYTPFWNALRKDWSPSRPLPAVTSLARPKKRIASDRLDDLGLLPRKPDWAGGIREAWTPGEAGATERLDEFLATAVGDYTEMRNRPDVAGTSRLSPHLHFGEISARRCWHAAAAMAARKPGVEKGAETFLKEIVWREFSQHLLFHFPDLPEAPFRKEFARFPWAEDSERLEAWQRGRTGYPIVDAGMRELWVTGWMHNRVRMIVASVLIKHLLIPWQHGEAWFWDTLVDADLANNAASWQWVAGSGADAAPYFRIFNPVKQGETFDPEGNYVRRWVPELSRLGNEHIHAPWLAPASVLAKAGIVLGKTYPDPIVDHAWARDRALAAFEGLKTSDGGKPEAGARSR